VPTSRRIGDNAAMILSADHLWQPGGWQSDARLAVGADGRIASAAAAAPAERIGRFVLPGVANIHSHAFQRAMAGLVERQGDPADSFWTWRELMYALAARVDPESLHAVASMLYAEMLEAGYTTVCEFHYLHNAPDGRPYADPAALSLALIQAARDTGIRLVLLPVLYQAGGFDGRALSARQQRFGLATDAYLALLQRLQREGDAMLMVGAAFHSLRAVPPAAMREVLAAIAPDMPLHIHISEQIAEVEDCLAHRGDRPVAWLLDEFAVDRRWCLVHATHLDASETTRLAASGASVALCPTTEANLGDGLFPLAAFRAAGGRWGIGSDSHVSVSLVEELRWLEYGQRLAAQRRNIAASAEQPSCGETLFAEALVGGAAAAGLGDVTLQPGCPADLLVLDDSAVELAERPPQRILDSLVFAGNRRLVRDVMANGNWCVRDGQHVARERVEAAYRRALGKLLAQSQSPL
jgi:formimidoylglutamate deiminase